MNIRTVWKIPEQKSWGDSHSFLFFIFFILKQFWFKMIGADNMSGVGKLLKNDAGTSIKNKMQQID